MDRPGRDLLFPGVPEEENAEQDEGDAQELSHVQGHALLETDLRLLDKLDQDPAPETDDHKDSQELSTVHLIQPIFINTIHKGENSSFI